MCYEQEQKKRQKKRKYWIHNVFWARGEEEIYALFERLKDDMQKLFKYFRMSILKSENFKQLLYTDNEKNAWWRQHNNRRKTGFNFKVSSSKCILLSPLSLSRLKASKMR